MIIQNPTTDPLSEVLALTGFRAACSVRLQAGGHWALRFNPIELKFNVVRRGDCWLRVGDMAPWHLHPGDCFVVSRTPFILASDPALEAIDASAVFAPSGLCATLGVGDQVELLGGSVSLASASASELLAILPPVIVIRAQSPDASSFAWLLDELDKEWRSAQPGAHALCNDLLRVIFVHALRHHIAHAEAADLAWLGGLRDPAIANVMRAIHSDPQRHWKLAQLAQIACMSRSSFAAQFKARVGQTPVEYATRWRMQVAAARLSDHTQSVAKVAASLGYMSDAAFGVAFRRIHGQTPGQYRRRS